MKVNERQLREVIRQGEGISTEFKTCRGQLTRDVYETVCAFLNRHGGTILLGVKDSGEVTGIDPDAVGQIKKNFVTAVNDGADPEMIEGDIFRTIVKVPEFGATVERPAAPEVTRDAELEVQWRAQSGAQSVAIIRFLASRPLSARDLVDKLGQNQSGRW